MARPKTAGDLTHRVAFDKRAETNDADDDGNHEGDWVEQFNCAAGYVHLHGGESVIASRLQGQHTQVIFVRAWSRTCAVTTDWRIRDKRTGRTYNISDVTQTEDRAWVEFLCQSGGADG